MTDKPKCQHVDVEKCNCTSDVIHKCRNEAVIRIGDLNLCQEHAPESVMELLNTAKHARVFVNSRERIKRPEGIDLYDAAIAAMAPRAEKTHE